MSLEVFQRRLSFPVAATAAAAAPTQWDDTSKSPIALVREKVLFSRSQTKEHNDHKKALVYSFLAWKMPDLASSSRWRNAV
jgi:hypothetical protein